MCWYLVNCPQHASRNSVGAEHCSWPWSTKSQELRKNTPHWQSTILLHHLQRQSIKCTQQNYTTGWMIYVQICKIKETPKNFLTHKSQSSAPVLRLQSGDQTSTERTPLYVKISEYTCFFCWELSEEGATSWMWADAHTWSSHDLPEIFQELTLHSVPSLLPIFSGPANRAEP